MMISYCFFFFINKGFQCSENKNVLNLQLYSWSASFSKCKGTNVVTVANALHLRSISNVIKNESVSVSEWMGTFSGHYLNHKQLNNIKSMVHILLSVSVLISMSTHTVYTLKKMFLDDYNTLTLKWGYMVIQSIFNLHTQTHTDTYTLSLTACI